MVDGVWLRAVINPEPVRIVRLGILVTIPILLLGCAVLRPHSPSPRKFESSVQIPGMPGVRAWGDEFSPVFQKDAIEARDQENKNGLFEKKGIVSILAISGGGGDGAFGAGLLCGHSAIGGTSQRGDVSGKVGS